jgi:hypothetical protein
MIRIFLEPESKKKTTTNQQFTIKFTSKIINKISNSYSIRRKINF